jgi:hypothetical protein
MAALVNALDNFTPTQLGENGHSEYGWSNSIRERIVQLSFQLTRQNRDNKKSDLSTILFDLLSSLKTKIHYHTTLPELSEVIYHLSILYKMIGQTRDIIDGKGEYSLTYMMIWVWYKVYPELAKFALKCLVQLEDPGVTAYGSWKDMKYFCQYCFDNSDNPDHELIDEQLRKDNESFIMNQGKGPISLVSKWVPREKSKYSWLFEKLAYNYFNSYILYAKHVNSITKAKTKCKMDYRKLVSTLNKHLDTVQIKQCANNWAEIDPSKQTSITMHKQKHAFLNLKKGCKELRSDSEDRILCANHFKEYIAKAVKGEVEIKGKRVGLNDFTKDALSLISQGKSLDTQNLIDLLNAQWKNNSSMNGALGKMIAMVDVSGSMDGDPLYAAIALGIRVAEKSLLGKRVMTFSAQPSWVNLDGLDNFVDMVERVKHVEWGMNTNFNKALTMILDAIVSQKLEPDDVEDMVLAIFSDMQIDAADPNSKSMYELIEKKYSEAGIKLWGKPFKPPHILFWNLRSTSGFPTLSSQKNTSMMSGFSPALLNLFCEEGMNALDSCTPWSLLLKSLENERYQILERRIAKDIHVDYMSIKLNKGDF